MKKQTMKTFGINAENSISIYDGPATRPDEINFNTEEQLALVAENLPTSRLVEIWNALPEVTPVRKFKDRKTAISRIWNALQNVEVPTDVPAEVVPEVSATEQPDGQEPETEDQPKPIQEAIAEPEPAPEQDAEEAPQTPDVGPAGTESAEKTTRAKKTPKTPRSANGTREGSKTGTVLALLKREGGVSLQELMSATGWQAHSVRGFLSGTIGKKMGLAVVSAKQEDGSRVYSVRY